MKTKEQIIAEHSRGDRNEAPSVTITRIDLSFWNVVILSFTFGIVWAVMGLIGYLVYTAVT